MNKPLTLSLTVVALMFATGCVDEELPLEPEEDVSLSETAVIIVSGAEAPDDGTTAFTARGWAGTAVMNDKIVVAGGGVGGSAGFGGDETPIVEALDPAGPSWLSQGSLNVARWGLGVASVDGKIYAFGGTAGCCSAALPTVEAYDPATGQWSQLPDGMNVGRWKPAVAVYQQNILAFGGGASGNQSDASDIVEVFDPSMGAWSLGQSMPTPRWGAAASELDGKVYVFGGHPSFSSLSDPRQTAVLEVYDPAADTWEFGDRASLSVARWDHAGVTVNGRIYALGGVRWNGSAFEVQNVLEEYDPATDTWSLKTPMPTARTGVAAAVVDGKIYAIGGFDGTAVTSVVEVYDPTTNTWTDLEGGVTSPPLGFAVDRLEVTGNISGGFVDDFDDGVVGQPPTDAINCSPAVQETGGFLLLPLPSTFCVLGELSATHRLTDGSGDAIVTATFRPELPETGEGYRLQMFTAGSTSPNESVSIEVQNAGTGPRIFTSVIPVSGDPPVVGDPLGGEPIPIDLTGVEEVQLRLRLDDGINQVFASFSLDGGSSFSGVPLPVDGEVMVRATEAVAALSSFGPSENRAPIADAGPDQTSTSGPIPRPVTLDGSASFDPDPDDILTYRWTEGETLLGEGETVEVLLNPGRHVVTLTVSDGKLEATDILVITVFKGVVVLLHGIYSNPLEAFGQLPTLLRTDHGQGAFVVVPISYEEEAACGSDKSIIEIARDFGDNLRHLPSGVFVVAHSMGGLVARAFLGGLTDDPDYISVASKVNKLITLGSPYYGSNLATVRELGPPCALERIGRPANDLSYGSDFLWDLHNAGSVVLGADMVSVIGIRVPHILTKRQDSDGIVLLPHATPSGTHRIYVQYKHSPTVPFGDAEPLANAALGQTDHCTFELIHSFFGPAGDPTCEDAEQDPSQKFGTGSLLVRFETPEPESQGIDPCPQGLLLSCHPVVLTRTGGTRGFLGSLSGRLCDATDSDCHVNDEGGVMLLDVPENEDYTVKALKVRGYKPPVMATGIRVRSGRTTVVRCVHIPEDARGPQGRCDEVDGWLGF